MKIGMLWFDNNSKTSFAEKCNRAIKFYTAKYGMRPTAITIHPAMLEGLVIATLEIHKEIVHDIVFYTSKSVLFNHFWVGLED